ncbi:putative baseplate assembly protein [Actinoplanes sp. CA-051413]|uniref:putative baseplate assembly protein n=1 Tax=Actinoplanes sp. CA-051413 TaxID=3239899 RepID=UPI003D988179
MSTTVSCSDDRRRAAARSAGSNGIDSIDVGADQLTLTVRLFAEPPADLEPANFRIDGGRRVTGIRVEAVADCDGADPVCVRLTVDRHGDRSTYRLCVVERGAHGRPGTRPHPAFDPRYSCQDFTFKQNCAALQDCAAVCSCPSRAYVEPEIDYLAKDYDSFRRLLLDRMSLTTPRWIERHVPDLGTALVELLAYEGDRLSYRQDATAPEAYFETARRRVSIRRHARLVDYAVHDGCAARAWVCLETTEEVTLPAGGFRFASLPPTSAVQSGTALAQDLDRPDLPAYEVFEPVTVEDVAVHPGHSRISLWTWGDGECCLPSGATAATLVDGPPQPEQPDASERKGGGDDTRVLHLRPGDVLIFAEATGPRTGVPGDADSTHSQAVRLTSVTPARDDLYRQPLLEVSWSREDALSFPLCVTARGGPRCEDLEVGVAFGNVVLVEHGRSLDWCGGSTETHEQPVLRQELSCPDPPEFGCASDGSAVPGPAYPPIEARFRPALRRGPVTQRAPFPAPATVARAQAEQLRGAPERARARLTAWWSRVRHGGELSDANLAYLDLLFGPRLVRRLQAREHPESALAVLLARFDDLLAAKTARLAELVRRARTGYLLDASDEGWEIAQAWGDAEARDVAPGRSLFRGPAGAALRPDPRAALPALRVTVPAGDDALAGPGGKLTWRPRRDLLSSGPDDRHVVGEVNDDGVLTLRFGDGRAGAALPSGRPIEVAYRVGNGSAGNLGRGAINTVVFCGTRTGGISRVFNPLPASGGVDPEPVADVRRRAPHELSHRLLRAITPADYAAIAAEVPGIQRAAADLRWVGSWYEVQVAVDPVDADTAPDWLLAAVREALHPVQRIGHDVSVRSAVLVPLDLALRVRVEPDFVAGHVARSLTGVFGEGRLPDGRLGLFHPDNLSFGTPVRVSQLVAAAAATPGVRHVEVTRLQPLFGPAGTALEDGLLRIGPLEVPQLAADPARPEYGLLTLDMEGGR